MEKTIADYQPDILIREAIGYLAECDMRGIPYRDEFRVVTMLAANDINRQEVHVAYDEVAAWVATQATEAVGDKLASTIHPAD